MKRLAVAACWMVVLCGVVVADVDSPVALERTRRQQTVGLVRAARMASNRGAFRLAERACEACLMLDPGHAEATALLERARGKDEPASVQRQRAALEQKINDAIVEAALLEMERSAGLRSAGRVEEADASVEIARLLAPEDRRVREVVGEVEVRGVGWCRRIDTEHYEIITNMPSDTRASIAQAAEDDWRCFHEFFGDRITRRVPGRLRMYYFETTEQFIKFHRAAGRPAASQYGFYDPNTKEAYFRKDEELFGLLDALYHEGAHQLEDHVLAKSPAKTNWIVEALACYFETIVRDGDSVVVGEDRDCWELKGPTRYFPLDRFCDLNRAAWDSGIAEAGNYNLHYGQAATFFRFLVSRGEGSRRLLIDEVILKGRSSWTDLCQIYGWATPADIEDEYIVYANTLYRTPISK